MDLENEISAAVNFLESQKVSGMFVVDETKGISCVVGENGFERLRPHLFMDYTVEYLLIRRSKETEAYKTTPRNDKRYIPEGRHYRKSLQLPTIALLDIQTKEARHYLISETHAAWNDCFGFWYFANGSPKGFSNSNLSSSDKEFLKRLEQDFLENHKKIFGDIRGALLVR